MSAINARVSANVDAIISGHSHNQYNCQLPDPRGQKRTVIQSLSFGRLLSVLDLKINRTTGDVLQAASRARNEVVTRRVTPDPAVHATVTDAVTKSTPIANREVGTITADIVKAPAPSGGPIDLDAFTAYLTAHSPVSPPPTDRITVAG